MLSLFNSLNQSKQQTQNKHKLYNYEIMSFPSKKTNFGNYTGAYPKQAAEKAFTFLSSLMLDKVKEDGNFIVFSIRKKSANEINSNKIHKFIGTVVELENPVYNNSLERKLKFKNVVSKYNPELDKIQSVTNHKIHYRNKQPMKQLQKLQKLNQSKN